MRGYRAGVFWMRCWRAAAVLALLATLPACERRKGNMVTTKERPEHTNRLAREKSPYLLQHQHNPVDWHAWGEEAFAKADKAVTR